MVKELIAGIARLSRDAAILIAGIYVFVWAFKQINPAYLLEKSEAKQIAYVDMRIQEKERLDAQRHQEQMRVVAEINRRAERIEDQLKAIIKRDLAAIPLQWKNNNN